MVVDSKTAPQLAQRRWLFFVVTDWVQVAAGRPINGQYPPVIAQLLCRRGIVQYAKLRRCRTTRRDYGIRNDFLPSRTKTTYCTTGSIDRPHSCIFDSLSDESRACKPTGRNSDVNKVRKSRHFRL